VPASGLRLEITSLRRNLHPTATRPIAILYDPASIEARSVVNVIGFAQTTLAAADFVETSVRERLEKLAR